MTGLLVGTLALRSGAQPRQAQSTGSLVGSGSSAGSISATPGVSSGSSAIVCPATEAPSAGFACGPVPAIWCCPGGAVPGVTVTGQATLKGEGAQVRDEAIRQAVADAKEQAEVAAQAASVKLGQVLSMQISASGYPYPLEAGAGGGTAVPPSAPCPSDVKCPPTITVPVQTFVSVTITWAIG